MNDRWFYIGFISICALFASCRTLEKENSTVAGVASDSSKQDSADKSKYFPEGDDKYAFDKKKPDSEGKFSIVSANQRLIARYQAFPCKEYGTEPIGVSYTASYEAPILFFNFDANEVVFVHQDVQNKDTKVTLEKNGSFHIEYIKEYDHSDLVSAKVTFNGMVAPDRQSVKITDYLKISTLRWSDFFSELSKAQLIANDFTLTLQSCSPDSNEHQCSYPKK